MAQTLEIRKFSLDPVKRVVYLRDQVSKIVAARSMFADLSQVAGAGGSGRRVSGSDQEFGAGLRAAVAEFVGDRQFQLFPWTTRRRRSNSLTSFLTFGGGATFFGVGIAASAVLATFTKSDSDVILKSQIVTLDGQAATLHVGERYPLVTATYSGGSTNQIGSASLPD